MFLRVDAPTIFNDTDLHKSPRQHYYPVPSAGANQMNDSSLRTDPFGVGATLTGRVRRRSLQDTQHFVRPCPDLHGGGRGYGAARCGFPAHKGRHRVRRTFNVFVLWWPATPSAAGGVVNIRSKPQECKPSPSSLYMYSRQSQQRVAAVERTKRHCHGRVAQDAE